jgi:hypothetical protein
MVGNAQLESEAAALRQGLDAAPLPEASTVISSQDLASTWQLVQQARANYEAVLEKVKAAQEDQTRQDQQLTQRRKDLEKERADLKAQREEHALLADELAKREIELGKRELEAESGYFEQHRASLEKVQQVLEGYKQGIAASLTNLTDTSSSILVDFASSLANQLNEETTQVQRIITSIAAARETFNSSMEGRLKDLHTLQKQLELQEVMIAADKADYKDRISALDSTIEERVNERTQEIQQINEDLKRRYQECTQKREQLFAHTLAWSSIEKRLGKDPTEIEGYFRRLEEDNQRLRHELTAAPAPSLSDDVLRLEHRVEELEDERAQADAKNAQLRQQLSARSVEATEVQALVNEKNALEACNKLLTVHLGQLQEKVDEFSEAKIENAPFPQCVMIDGEKPLSRKKGRAVSSLPDLAVGIRQAIAGQKFYYEERDIRGFLAGMAMSHLLILQGISGTGKTGLPREFATAIDGSCETIEVQSTWRDRNDLLGYFNAFEKRFYEGKFLQALYRAGSDGYKDHIYFILLDEMNLAYVEQYFADFLSVLGAPSARPINLVSRSLGSLPKRLDKRDGVSIAIPENVWFVGTANRDETTKDIADKTYDRAHIMELPPRFSGSSQSTGPIIPTTTRNLARLFNDAVQTHQGEVASARNFLKNLQEAVLERFAFNWGNRLDDQVARFVPVNIAAGGDLATALDDIVAMRILRKVRDRYEIEDKQLENFQSDLAQLAKTAKLNPEDFSRSQMILRLEREKKAKGI